ncbi:TetR family transcriptional regulator [Bogoriella caseilytica]|uniref:TetR family transcriptional regulator n=2 Tax=Bogoriella caseilytica TaxID=56055 RepID=A0A3N2BBR7_9MICO|nr:TetR family transcriptional regulator [Bogoriella caseilytica]
MGRTAKYTDQDILDAALGLTAEGGVQAATVVAIAKRIGAPSGSIYHRFASRDLILATLWIRTVRRFQGGFLEALALEEPVDAARRAVSHTLQWSASHHSEAQVLTMYRREDLLELWPEELGPELASLNDEVRRAMVRFTAAQFAVVNAETLGRARFALIEIPTVAVRQMMGNGPLLPWLERTVTDAAMAVLRSTP